YVGGTSSASSANLALLLQLWSDDVGGLALFGVGGSLALDRRPSPPGPGIFDGLFVQLYFSANIAKLFGFDSSTDWARKPGQIGDPRIPRSGRDDSLGVRAPAPPPPPRKEPVLREIIVEDEDEALPEPPKKEAPVTEP